MRRVDKEEERKSEEINKEALSVRERRKQRNSLLKLKQGECEYDGKECIPELLFPCLAVDSGRQRQS